MGVCGPHTQVKCVFKALIYGTCKKNRTYSQMIYQLYQSHSLTATGLKSGKNPNIGSLWAFQRPQRDLKIKASDFKSVTHKDYT